ncbi:MAG: tyrosine-type recombinase/integrase [Novosphingobium sp.]|nr:tyrosine-type recombinase/integrase [Novosphingobium sp.]
MKRKNPYPGLTRVVDRHGKVRWRFRKKGLPSRYVTGEYGSKAFQAAYEAALKGEQHRGERHVGADYGTFEWLIRHYLRTPDWQKLRPTSRYPLSKELDRFRRAHGHRLVVDLRREHVEILIAEKAATPAAANKLLKLFRRLCRFAIRRNLIAADPTQGVSRYRTNPDGFHTWTDAEIDTFEAHHGANSKAVLALRLMLYTGAARQDVARLGWQNTKGSRIQYRRLKTGGEVDLPIHPDLLDVLDQVPRDQMMFVTHTGGRPYKPESFGNWFRDQCRAAGLPECAPHGLRKAGATRLANAGATEFEIMAFLGHKSPREAATYTSKANRARLGDSAMEKLQRVSNPVKRLDISSSKTLKEKEK